MLLMLIGQDIEIAFKILTIGIFAHALYQSALFLWTASWIKRLARATLGGLVSYAHHVRGEQCGGALD